jgi:1,4-dihydroxy-2-naphthoate octaprenyltransferase
MLVFGTLPFLIGFKISNMPFEFKYLVISIVFGLIAGSYYLFISNFEIETDKKAGVKNTCTILGYKNTINIAIIVFFTSMILYLFYFYMSEKIVILCFLITAPLVILTRFTKNSQVLIVIVSLMFLFWNGVIFLLLSIYTFSILTIFLFLIIIVVFSMVFYTWRVTEI